MTKLNEWMGDGRDDRWLAAQLGVSRSQASRIRRGLSIPTGPAAFKIERLTKGSVKAVDLLVRKEAA